MAQIATSNRQITLYCIEDTTKARQTLAYAAAEGVPVLVVDISKTPITGSQLAEIADRLGVKIKDLIDQDSDLFRSKFETLNLSSDDWIKMIHQNPEILKQPIALRGESTMVVTTPTDITHL